MSLWFIVFVFYYVYEFVLLNREFSSRGGFLRGGLFRGGGEFDRG